MSSEIDIKDMLKLAVRDNMSDLLLLPGNPPIFKYREKLLPYGVVELTSQDIEAFAKEVLAETEVIDIDKVKSRSLSYEVEDLARFRVTIFRSRFKLCLSIRIIPVETRTFEELNLPLQIADVARLKRGLVLVTGATGQGKSTTISSIIEEINRTREAIIITIEDPIEFTYGFGKSIIIQREIGEDIASLKDALRESLRHTPNVLMIGEIRDKESLEGVLTLAETGHLVISAIHTADAKTTILQILDLYSNEDKKRIANRLVGCLQATISQRLVNSSDNQKADRFPVCEILRMTPSISDCITSFDKFHKLNEYIENGDIDGMQTFDKHFIQLVKEGKIDYNTAVAYADNPGRVRLELQVFEGKEVPPTTSKYNLDF
jgi:twitching motility protein PilT